LAKIIVDPERVRAFASAAAFERWLSVHHAREPELWLRLHEKGSGLPTITRAEAIDVALCWGWIDGIAKSYDESSFLQRFTPRRKTSIWSQINCENVRRLTKAGHMQPSGLAEVEAARADGRWDRAYASPRTATLPADLLAAIEAHPEAKATLARLDRQNQYALSFRLQRLKTPAGRERAIARFVEVLARGEGPHGAPPALAPAARRVRRAKVAKVPKKTSTKRPKKASRSPSPKRSRARTAVPGKNRSGTAAES
jgi:uncharacterized protein YdeI (YjbR/CyaY-like superfamily)